MLRRLTTWLGEVVGEAMRTDLEEMGGAGPLSWPQVIAVAGAVLFVLLAVVVVLK